MRTRTTVYESPDTITHADGYYALGICGDLFRWVRYPTNDLNGSFKEYTFVKTIDDIVTPNYYRRSADGEIINNPYTKTETYWHRQAIDWYGKFSQVGWYYCPAQSIGYTAGSFRVGNVPPDPFLTTQFLALPTLNTQAVIDQAVTGAFAKAGEQDVQGLVILAEGNKTIKSFISIGKRLLKIGRALRKWDVGNLSKQFSAKELADRWMEGRYAIRPVVYDMCDVVKALKRNRDKTPLRQTYRSGASDSCTASQVVMTHQNPGYYEVYGMKVSSRIFSARTGVLAAIDALTEATIWGLDQPFTAMWELVPFSFVVDWFFNVGKTIASWSPKAGLRTLASWVTVHDTVSQAIYLDHGVSTYNPPYNTKWDGTYTLSGGFVNNIIKTTSRQPNPNLPILPTFSVKLDAAKLLDLVIMGKRFFK